MKTFIWNTEYQVYLAVGENVDNARGLLKYKWFQDAMAYSDPKNGIDISTNLNRARSTIGSAQEFFTTLAKEPDFIIEEKKAIIYDHGNE